jgi:hypothetical protein
MHSLHRPRVAALIVAAAALLTGAPAANAQVPPDRVFLTPSADQAPRALGPGVLRERRVDLNPLALGGPTTPPAERLFLDLFADVSYVAVRDRAVRHESGLTWYGHLEGLPLSSAVFAVADGVVAGHVASPLGQLTLAQEPDGGYLVQQVAFEVARPDDAVRPPTGAAGTGTATSPGLDLTRRPASAASAVVDLLVVYSTAATDAFGGAAQFEAAVAVGVGLLDAALRSAGTGGARLTGVREVGYAHSGDIFTSLANLQNGVDGVLDDVYAMRELYAADVVVLVTERRDARHCGLGYVAAGFPDFAFGVLEGRDCTQGLMLAHVVGHGLGLHHDWFATTDGGLRPSSKGYVSLAGRFATVMALPDHCAAAGVPCTQLPAFSSPLSPHGGLPIGVAAGTRTTCTAGEVDSPPCDADAAATLAESVPLVAAYRVHSRLDGGQSLLPGQSISAQAAGCSLTYQADGNLVAYQGGVPYFHSSTHGTPAGRAAMQLDGNFVLYDAAGAPVWATGTAGNPGAHLEIQLDCDVVLYSDDGAPLWASGTP